MPNGPNENEILVMETMVEVGVSAVLTSPLTNSRLWKTHPNQPIGFFRVSKLHEN